MIWPDPEGFVKIPEGHYSFRLNKEPELKKFTFKDRDGNDKEGRKVIIYAVGLNESGEYRIADAFLPWEDRYRELLSALGVEHGKDINVQGTMFEADVRWEMDKKDPTKSWPRIVNIVTQADIPNGGGDDIPF